MPDPRQTLELRARVEHLNRWFSEVFNEPTRISSILLSEGFSSADISELSRERMESIVDRSSGALRDFLTEVLPENRSFVLIERFALHGLETATLAQCGETLGVSRERARQLQKNGLRRLKTKKRRARIREIVAGVATAAGVLRCNRTEEEHSLSNEDRAELESRLREVRAGDFTTVDELNQCLERL